MPVVDQIATEYEGEVTFLAIAGRGSFEATETRAAQLMPSGAMLWTLDESVWEAYEVFGQPVTFAISADGVIADTWFGIRDEAEIRTILNELAGKAA